LHQAEAAIRWSNVTISFNRYDHIFIMLPTYFIMSVRDLINFMQPNTQDACEQLKVGLTVSYNKTKWQQVHALLDMPTSW
jgi:hypothetical protein